MLVAQDGWAARRLAGRPGIVGLGLLAGVMVADGTNSLLVDLRAPYLYTPSNPLRLGTGLAAGMAVAPLLLWLVGRVALPPTGLSPGVLMHGWSRWIAPAVILVGFAGLVVSGRVELYYAAALLSVGGVVTLISGALLLVVLFVSGLAGRVVRPTDLIGTRLGCRAALTCPARHHSGVASGLKFTHSLRCRVRAAGW